ncbi:Transcription elongation factor GreA [Nymphon striatum]|nr:Transcription elongation factor GreA [Nymphon striatum]
MEKIPMTKAGHSALEAELKVLKSEERPAIIRAIAEAREHGDLSENAEYHSAREKQSFIEGRIKELEGVISLAEVIDPAKLSGSVKFGATVTLVDEDTDEEKTWQIVGPAIDAIRQAYLAQAKSTDGSNPSVTQKLDEIAAAQKKTENALAMFTSSRDHSQPPRSAATAAGEQAAEQPHDQPTLALGTPGEALAPPLSNDDFIRALNFPETADDEAGFAALRRALKDRNASQLIQAGPRRADPDEPGRHLYG